MHKHVNYGNAILIALLLTGLLFTPTAIIKAQSKKRKKRKLSTNEYIEKYKSLAISEMHRTQIPASITLAQGILESGNGNSYLARKGRNHFGIKCHRRWRGKKIYASDDAHRECFRRYKSVYASYIDHSNFLVNNKRYNSLFNLSSENYKGWAKGLLKAGYATDKKYASRLISIINKYDLNKFDAQFQYNEVPNPACKERILANPINHNGIKTVIFDCAVTPEQIEKAYNVDVTKLTQYNNFNESDTVNANTIVYLQAPKRRSRLGINEHVVNGSETMESIAQLYGIKVSSLYKRNKLSEGMQPVAGETIALKKRSISPPKTKNLKVSQSKEDTGKAMQITYIVKKGDTLYSLSRRFDTTVNAIKSHNNLPSNMIKEGQKLKIMVNK